MTGEEAFKQWTDTDSLYGSRHLAEKWSQEIVPLFHKRDQDDAAILNRALHADEPPAQVQYGTVLSTIDLFVLLDLLGTAGAQIYNYQYATPSSDHAYQRLVDIQSRLSKASLLSKPLQERVAKKQGVFLPDFSPNQLHGIEDDHIPFLKRHVPVVHVIPVPFPKVWHTQADNAQALDEESIRDLSLIFRVFVAEYLGVQIE